MSNLSDQQPLVPPALRRFQAVKEQQTIHLKHNPAEVGSKGEGHTTPSGSSNTKSSSRRHPKSTVHGVVNQFGQLHEQKSGIDRLLSSVGNMFRRMCTQEVRTLRLLDDSQNVDVPPDENCVSPQNSAPYMKSGGNSVDVADTGMEEIPAIMITTFKEVVPSQKIHKGASSKSHNKAKSKSHDGAVSKCHDEAISKYHDGAESKCHDGATANSYGDSHRRTRWTSDSSKKSLVVCKHDDKQSANVLEKMGGSSENSDNTEVLRGTPDCNRVTPLSYSRHRKLNFSKIFRIKRNSGQKYSLPAHLSPRAEHGHPLASPCGGELDDKGANSYDSKEVVALESVRLSFLRRSSSSANSSISTNSSQNNLVLPGRKSCQVKSRTNKTRKLAGSRHSSQDKNSTVDMEGQGRVPSRSNIATHQCSLQRLSSDLNLAHHEHLTDSTDELTQLIWAAF